ncbi:hypothetical protein EJB05_24849, partial [Eragrostis curvula]
FAPAIPSSMERLKGLEVLDLAHNNLSGNIPEFLGRMKSLVNGNQGLCGGIPELKLPLCSTSADTTKKRSSYADLVHATKGFASENLIGVGSFGSVYKGGMMIHNQQVIIAVKVLNLSNMGLLKVLLRNGHDFKALV